MLTHGRSARTAEISARSEIESDLATYFRERTTVARSYGEHFERLWALAGENVLGGKMLRPLLLVDTYDALRQPGQEDQRDTVIALASAVELLHFSFLLHDDIIDGDLMRRGRPNLIGTLGTEATALARDIDRGTEQRHQSAVHWARSGGMLMGDLMLASAHQAFARAQLPHPSHIRLLEVLDHTIMESVAGEHLDVTLSAGVGVADLATIMAMTSHKTATYSFEFPLRVAAQLAGAGRVLEDALARAGQHLGLAFQLQDDLLSIFGDAHRHGKDPFSDLREGKQTALIAYARLTSAWPAIEPYFGRSQLSAHGGIRVRRLLAECGAQRFVQGLVVEQLQAFHEVLDAPTTGIPSPARDVLRGLAAKLEGRQA